MLPPRRTGPAAAREVPGSQVACITRWQGYGDTFLLRRIPARIRYTATDLAGFAK